MKSLAILTNMYTSLSSNTTGANQLLGIQLMGDQHRYLIQKYFDNERTVTMTTVGGQTLTLTAAPDAGVTTATLSAAWPYTTGSQLINFTGTTKTVTTTVSLAASAVSATLSVVWPYTTAAVNTTFSNGDKRVVSYTSGSAAITWGQGLSSTATTSLVTVSTSDQRTGFFTKGSTTLTWQLATDSFSTVTLGTVGYQNYNIPANISKIKNDTINVGQLRFVPAPIQTRAEWDLINFLPYTSDIPNYFFIYNGQLLLWPIPSTTGNIITFNYKARIPDFSTAFIFSSTAGAAYSAGSTAFDYQVGSLSGITAGSTSITGVSSAWNATGKYPLNVDVTQYNLYLQINAPYGEGIWYPIQSFQSDTALTLGLPIVSAPSATAAANQYSIGQLPVLSEDFADMLPYGALMTYYGSIKEPADTNKFKLYQTMYTGRLALLEDYAGTKSVNVDLGATPQLTNPNLYPYAQTSS